MSIIVDIGIRSMHFRRADIHHEVLPVLNGNKELLTAI
jgi:hypothetical protein